MDHAATPDFVHLCLFSFSQTAGTSGEIAAIVLNDGMKCVSFESCAALSGTLMAMPPPSVQELNILYTGVKIDVAAIEWPATTTELWYVNDGWECYTTDPDNSKEGAATREIRIECNGSQVIGTSSAVSRNDIMILRGTHEILASVLVQR